MGRKPACMKQQPPLYCIRIIINNYRALETRGLGFLTSEKYQTPTRRRKDTHGPTLLFNYCRCKLISTSAGVHE